MKKIEDWIGFRSVAYMMRFLKGKRLLFWLSSFMLGSFGFFQNVFTGQIYCVIITAGQTEGNFFRQLFQIFLLLLGLASVMGIGAQFSTQTGAYGDRRLRSLMTKKLCHMPMRNWYGRHSGEWLTLLGKDAESASAAYKQQITGLIEILIEFSGGCIVLLAQSKGMLLYALISGLLYFGIGMFQIRRKKRFEAGSQKATAATASCFSDLFNGFIVARFYMVLQSLLRKQSETIEKGYTYGKRIASVSIINGALGQVGYTLAYCGAFITGLLFVYHGNLSLTTMLAIWPISMGVSFSMMRFSHFMTDTQGTVVAISRIKAVMDLPEESQGARTEVKQTNIAAAFHNVSFFYEPGRPVLRHINLIVYKGEKIAFVGESGSGKSTLLKLLLRFYDVQEGDVTVGGHSVKEYTLETLRGQFSYVSQNTHLLGGSIYENISIVKKDTSEDAIREAARRACAEEFIEGFPMKYETFVGVRGSQISGGQRQRLAIARAFLKDAPIMILDEITAALDSESECQVQDALKHVPEGKTLLMITHRLSAAVSADRIVVMKKGQIVEIGTHKELLAHDGYYAKLWKTWEN